VVCRVRRNRQWKAGRLSRGVSTALRAACDRGEGRALPNKRLWSVFLVYVTSLSMRDGLLRSSCVQSRQHLTLPCTAATIHGVMEMRTGPIDRQDGGALPSA
jgi:hypothetical protein